MVFWHIMLGMGIGVVAVVVSMMYAKGIEGNYKYSSEEATLCPVCLTKLYTNEKRLRCGHVLHHACFSSLKARNFKTCPVCRADL